MILSSENWREINLTFNIDANYLVPNIIASNFCGGKKTIFGLFASWDIGELVNFSPAFNKILHGTVKFLKDIKILEENAYAII